MTKITKKAFSMILVMLMALSCMGITAFAETTVPAPTGLKTLAVFSDTIVIEEIEGCEYAILAYAEDDTVDATAAEYKAETVFTDLTAETKYAIYARVAATDTELAGESATINVTTGKEADDPAPVIDDADITVDHYLKNITCAAKTYDYNETAYTVKYAISPEESVDTSSLADGSTKFGNLVSGTTYAITAKITVAGIDFVSEAKSVTLKTVQNAPTTPVPVKVTDTTIEIEKIDNDAVYACALKGSTDADFVYDSKTKFEGLLAGETYVIRAKYNETAASLESPASYIELITKNASKGQAPAPVLADKTNTTIKVAAGSGAAYPCEYSIDNGATWDDDGLFTGLQANKKYDIIARYVYDASAEAESAVSETVSIFTNARANYEASLNNCSLSLPGDEINAKESFSVTANGDMYSEAAQYGDTRYIAYKVTYGETTVINETGVPVSLTAKLTAPDSAQDINVTVVYRLQKCVFVDDNGTSHWAYVTDAENNLVEKTQNYKVHIAEEYNQLKAFFIGLANFFLNTLPALIMSLFK